MASNPRPAPNRRPPTGEPEWLTLGQAAKFLGVAQSTIRKWSDQERVPAFYTPGGHRRYRRRDSDKCWLIRRGNRGIKMRLDTVETRSYQSDVRTSQDQNGQKTLMTPERKAALDVLEREFSDLLNSLQS